MKRYRTEFHPQRGEKNSHYGTIWIKNPLTVESKMIRKNDVIPDGWLKGRIVHFLSKKRKIQQKKECISNTKTNPKWITDGVYNKKISSVSFIPDGWRIGFTHKTEEIIDERRHRKEEKRHKREIELGKHFQEQKKIYTEMFQFYKSHSWKETIEKFKYKYSRPNFIQQCRRYDVE